ncbi:MAG TPA: hypothetical protein VE959_07915 [Bryobacteraceae bacterium]|nr:hypothetical protein [Bryobacteraceae bacterium]
MRRWLRETHGTLFELYRHFLLGFFDSDLITATGQTTTALIGAISLLLPCTVMVEQPLKFKYDHFSSLPVPGPYREVFRADELWMITLLMSVIGALTAIKWQSLFPGLRDYRALASLPLRPGQVFLSKWMALFSVATMALAALIAAPGLVLTMVSTSPWAMNPSMGTRIAAHAAACAAGSYFFFFGLIALQGVLLNLLRPRVFTRVTAYLQGFLLAVMLVLVVLSFSIQPQIANAALRPEWSRWLPPVWFLGLHQAILGDPDPAMQALAHTARAALEIATALALSLYLISYRRHRALLVEGAGLKVHSRRWPAALLEWLVPDPRQQAVLVFITKTLVGSSQHRMILMGYGGFGLAILLSGMLGMREFVEPARVVPACFVYAHVILLIFLLIGVRHLFAMPTELGANWTFRITELDGRRQWMRAVDRLVLVSGAVVMLAIPFPVEFQLLGWRAVAESLLFVLFGLLCYEWAFSSWEKLPFTCSYLPGKTPGWKLAAEFLGLLTLLPVVSTIMLACLYNRAGFLVVLAVLLAAWVRFRALRRETWGRVSLKYEDLPDPAIHGLDLLK